SRPLKMTEADLFKRITSGLKYLPIGDPMDSDLARQFVDELRNEGYQGLEYKDRSDRFYPNGGIACHVLGFVTHDLKGAEGVEKGMDDFLLGESGRRIYDENRRLIDEVPPKDGKHV